MNILYQFEPIVTDRFIRGQEPVEVTFSTGDKKIFYAWDYRSMFKYPNLYDEYYGGFLMLDSPRIIWSYFLDILLYKEKFYKPLRILDVAAGSGLLGAEIRKCNRCEYLAGIDILEEASQAVQRDRPGIYDSFWVMDLAAITEQSISELKSYSFNSVFIVSATGGGDEDDDEGYKDVELEEYKVLLDILPIDAYITFNVRGFYTPGQKLIIKFLEEYCVILGEKTHFHRYLTNGDPTNFKTFVMKKVK